MQHVECTDGSLVKSPALFVQYGLMITQKVQNITNMKKLTRFLSYLSKVNATKFQVDDLNNPHSKDSVFQSRHSNHPRIPVL